MTENIELSIEGMTCAGCVRSVENALKSIEGVIKASPDLTRNSATVTANKNIDGNLLIKALADKGYKACIFPTDTPALFSNVLEFKVTGLSCTGCVRSVEKALGNVEGLESYSVDLIGGVATVRLGDNVFNRTAVIASVIEKIQFAGYQAELIEEKNTTLDYLDLEESKDSWRLFILAGILTLPLVGQMALMPFGVEQTVPPLIQLLLALPVQFIAGARFYKGIWHAFRYGKSNMDTLVAVGTSAAFGLSFVVMLGDTSQWLSWNSHLAHELYFEASAAVITLVLLGKILEERAKGKTNEALEALMKLQPVNALVERAGKQIEVPAEKVQLNDIVIVRPGDTVPVDGLILSGVSQLDEAMVTGEAMPVAKGPGETVTGGTMNGEGLLRLEPTTLGQNSKLSKIIAQVKEARTTKPEIQKLVDKISAIFVPAVLLLALLTFLGWWLFGSVAIEVAIINAATVLVIACPCALGLATPTAIMVGSGQTARMGILIKNADVVEKLSKATTVIFDKTGTLTEGRPEVVATHYAVEGAKDRTQGLVAGLTKDSSHPLSKAIYEFISEAGSTVNSFTDIKALPGLGVTGTYEKTPFLLGSEKLMKEEGADLTPYQSFVAENNDAGATQVWLVSRVQGQISVHAIYSLKDKIKEQSKQTIEALKKHNIKVVMLSGDQAAAANKVAEELGIDEVKASLLPADKLSYLKDLHTKDEVVVMVGDGINDAPALAGADVGLAMGDGSDVAISTADASLTQSNPYLVYKTIKAGQLIHQKIGHNLMGAFVYNVIGLPLAASGMLSPLLAGLAMALSSVTVMTSSLSLYSSIKRID